MIAWLLRPQRLVYPRVYGETSSLCPGSSSQHGLSPRVRGNPIIVELIMVSFVSTVYPRVYGETRP